MEVVPESSRISVSHYCQELEILRRSPCRDLAKDLHAYRGQFTQELYYIDQTKQKGFVNWIIGQEWMLIFQISSIDKITTLLKFTTDG